ncbi:nitrilase-related carbon-nitrogen hydrolase [Alkalihalobacterium alkalinitrilicum]|uniref:nitrilase-related carbon-nitrogen hydrolase n=1 Tax=Alkalihalobacterium alkalinitrilicum TaxID=427920 RepID=UPI000994E161|nr:nitrilase-related carbon-nitrogen hydrolase [Alkalihalobacterium alkalinitrilicum]
MTERTSEKISSIVSKLNCSDCKLINFAKGEIRCKADSCSCENKKIEHKTILDLYANLYFHLDNINLAEFETIIQDDDGLYQKIHQEIKDAWKHHTREYPYDTYDDKDLSVETKQRFEKSLLVSSNLEELLLTIVSWLYILDEHLAGIGDDLDQFRFEMELKTVRGILIRKKPSIITEYFSENEINPPVNPNYISLIANVKNFQLVQSKYQYYEVKHQRIYPFELLQGKTIEDISVGFLPGNLTFEDYKWEVSSEDENYNKAFVFQEIINADYYDHVEKNIEKVLTKKPNFIILPELAAPWELQTKIKIQIEDHFTEIDAKGLPEHLALLISGSFHEKTTLIFPHEQHKAEKFYNVSSIALGDGSDFYHVCKMNKFKVVKYKGYQGSLAAFRENHGIEKSAFDKREIKIIETPIGRIAILICVDLLNINVEEIITERHVNILFVMTLTQSPSTGKFLRRMQELGERSQTTVIICNNTGSFQNSDKIVAYFPGIKEPFTSDQDGEVYTIKEMIEGAQKNSAKKERKKRLLKKVKLHTIDSKVYYLCTKRDAEEG